MSSFPYKGLGHFPFHILRDELPDGTPFIHIDDWDGTTFRNGRPSGSSVDWQPVYGPGAPYCLPMTEWEFSIYFWRQRTIKTEFEVSINVPAASASASRTLSSFSNSASASLGAMTPDLEYSNGEKFADNRVERIYVFTAPSNIDFATTPLTEGQLVSPQSIHQSFRTLTSSQNSSLYRDASENKMATDDDDGQGPPNIALVSASVSQQIMIDVRLPSIDPISELGSWTQSRNFGAQQNVIIVGQTYWLPFPLWYGASYTGEIIAANAASASGRGSKSKTATRKLFLNAWDASVPANATEVTEGLVDVDWHLPGSTVTGKNHFLSYLETISNNVAGVGPGSGSAEISAPDPTITINKITVTPTEYLTYGGKFNATTGL